MSTNNLGVSLSQAWKIAVIILALFFAMATILSLTPDRECPDPDPLENACMQCIQEIHNE